MTGFWNFCQISVHCVKHCGEYPILQWPLVCLQNAGRSQDLHPGSHLSLFTRRTLNNGRHGTLSWDGSVHGGLMLGNGEANGSNYLRPCSAATFKGRALKILWLFNSSIFASVNHAIIGSDNGLSPGRRQAIIWFNDGILLITHLGTNFGEIHKFSFKKMHLKMSSATWRSCCVGLNVWRIMICVFIPCSVLILASDWLTTVKYGAVSHVWRHQRDI